MRCSLHRVVIWPQARALALIRGGAVPAAMQTAIGQAGAQATSPFRGWRCARPAGQPGSGAWAAASSRNAARRGHRLAVAAEGGAASAASAATPAASAAATGSQDGGTLSERMFKQMERNAATGEQGASALRRLSAAAPHACRHHASCPPAPASPPPCSPHPAALSPPQKGSSRSLPPYLVPLLQRWALAAPPATKRCAAQTPAGSPCARGSCGGRGQSTCGWRGTAWGRRRSTTPWSAAARWASSWRARCSCEVGAAVHGRRAGVGQAANQSINQLSPRGASRGLMGQMGFAVLPHLQAGLRARGPPHRAHPSPPIRPSTQPRRPQGGGGGAGAPAGARPRVEHLPQGAG